MSNNVEMHTEPTSGKAVGPPIKSCTLVRSTGPEEIMGLRADGVQVSVEDSPDSKDIRPAVFLTMAFGDHGLFCGYEDPDLVERFADGLRQAAKCLRTELKEWEKRNATDAS